MKQRRVHVEFDVVLPLDREYLPDGEREDDCYGALLDHPISLAAAEAYIREALETWGGQQHFLEPLFGGLKPRNLRITRGPR